MLYPLLLKPAYMERIWGGRSMEKKFGKQIPDGKIGESWEIASHEHGMSTVANGPLAGKNLSEIMNEYKEAFLGSKLEKIHYEKFPLLVKILDAEDFLSVQVHPDDAYAKKYENGEFGKTEAWYVIDAKPGAKLVYGIKEDCTKEEFQKGIEEGDLESYLLWMEVEKGDVIYIPAGMVHALGPGLLICEVQQNSDTVYRVYDWNRVDDNGNPRQLHVDKALDVINFAPGSNRDKVHGLTITEGESQRTFFIVCDYFAFELVDIHGSLQEKADNSRFFAYTVTEGQGTVRYSDGSMECKAGDSFIIPASLGDYSIEGECRLIKSYVPDKAQVTQYLYEEGCQSKDLKAIAGLME